MTGSWGTLTYSPSVSPSSVSEGQVIFEAWLLVPLMDPKALNWNLKGSMQKTRKYYNLLYFSYRHIQSKGINMCQTFPPDPNRMRQPDGSCVINHCDLDCSVPCKSDTVFLYFFSAVLHNSNKDSSTLDVQVHISCFINLGKVIVPVALMEEKTNMFHYMCTIKCYLLFM